MVQRRARCPAFFVPSLMIPCYGGLADRQFGWPGLYGVRRPHRGARGRVVLAASQRRGRGVATGETQDQRVEHRTREQTGGAGSVADKLAFFNILQSVTNTMHANCVLCHTNFTADFFNRTNNPGQWVGTLVLGVPIKR